MKKINLSNSELRLLLLFLSLLFLAVSYFFVFQKCVNKATEIEALNEESRQTLTKLEQMVVRQEEVEAETAEMNALVEDIIAKYPSDMVTEKAIAIVEEVEKNTEMHVSSISFLMDNAIGDIAQLGTTPSEEVQAVASDANMGYYAALSMNYEASYDAFKDMVEYIHSMKDRATIPSISATYDNETGNVTGVITVHLYYLTNTGKEYVAPEISGIGSGVENIFESTGIRNNGYLQSEVGINEEENE